MSERLLVTSALPYANGSIHLGHLVEYIQTDVYVRYRRACGDHVTYVCAADSHGTPIEVNAAKAGMTPKAFVEKYRGEQHDDFRRFGVEFSTYYTTDSPENARWAYRIYDALKAKGLIYKRSIEQLYCEHDRRFLPDRFVKGTCPKCGARDQYGDVCEVCGTTYDPRDLKDPRCAICGSAPVVRSSDHAYVDLKKAEEVIRGWVEAEGHLEPAVREQVKGWLADLQDWCITRDAPYFGFPVKDPDFPGKFLYVWVDAPIGYLSSAEHYFAEEAPAGERLSPAEFERRYLAEGAGARLEHFIGKDILRFHAVFWPAMLWAAGLKRPDRMPVHGHLTVNGEKMSKTRGSFITARTYLDAGLDPELLRYFYAANLGPSVQDLDLALDEFRNRVNADLANNVANLASRVAALVPRAGAPLAERPEPALVEVARSALAAARLAYRALEYREVVRAANQVADRCNKRMQEAKPWEDPASPASRALLFSCAKSLRAIATILWPVMPRFCGDLAAAFGQERPERWDEDFDPFAGGPVVVAAKPPQIARLDPRQVEKLIVVPPEARSPAPKVAKAASPAETATKASAKPAAAAPPGVIQYDDFAKVELRVAVVRSAEKVEGADKLLKLTVEAGDPEPRIIVAGIAQAYPEPGALVGKRIVVVANLAPRPLRGITSQGMLLAAGEAPNLAVVTVPDGIAPGTRVK
ncbi:methionine--tRNA ligase [Anaeromyxobacter sp. Fw109-5]|uniref:methionine--tRNA ligase n=1 Tax=Anaeromyxobacter sp. (strain Fw109-5) TaxID=404589 RepID=UPI0000ED75D7|nr:methionine--tRNA ligase [Anaeromyxobacter sp. Fw109-5]ABS26650.1 methionyl-tRNA synthetase [Anaeromyxobacter sp. Fw109-5]